MSAKLSIRFDLNPENNGSAAVPLDVIGEDLERVADAPETIPLGATSVVDVAPGTYLVRAHLPTGEVLSRQTTVADDQTRDVALRPKVHSPRETLGWAYYLKGTSRSTRVASLTAAKPLGPTTPIPPMRLWLCEPNAAWSLAGHVPLGYWPMAYGTISADTSVLVDAPNALAELRMNLDRNRGQYWLEIVNPQPLSRFVAVPTSGTTRVLVAADAQSPQDPDPFNAVVSTANPSAEALLRFMSTGDIASAKRTGEAVLRDAEMLLFAKLDDPCSATIAAYFLLSAANLERLHDWTDNLANWFPWMPDGAVIHAWHLLKQPKPNPDGARARLLEAEARGLPLYTYGLRLLLDGLSLFEDRDDPGFQVRAALDRLRPYGMAADWQAPTTTFHATNPKTPQPLPQPVSSEQP